MTTITRHRLFWPAAVLVLLLVSNVFFAPRFFTITLQDGHLYGSLIDILRGSAPLVLVALGMTLVIATGGIDLSVGSVMAISGAVACLLIVDEPTRGIDVGAKAEIQRLLVELADGGMAVLFVSAELEEVLRLSHKIEVLRDRRLVQELHNDGIDADRVMQAIASGANP